MRVSIGLTNQAQPKHDWMTFELGLTYQSVWLQRIVR